MAKRLNYKDQFAPWHVGQFMAFDLIDEVFEKSGSKGRSNARKAQFEADGFLVNMIIKQRDWPCKKTQN